jgi:DNA adenine methylase
MPIQTPFRYPGSKNKLMPAIMVYLDQILEGAGGFSDAFVGGGSVLLEVAAEYPKIELFANDKDRWVYCFWKIVADTDRTKLDQLLQLMETKPTIELFNQLREPFDWNDEVACAYRCIFFNRTTFSGIARSGPIGGQEQKSKWTVDCRYNYKKLRTKIEKCHQLLVGRTTVENKDILEYTFLVDQEDPVYLDPPYYVKGDMLYTEKMSAFDHKMLAEVLGNRPAWVLSYDDCPEIRSLYADKNIHLVPVRYCINGEKDDWKKMGELIITP